MLKHNNRANDWWIPNKTFKISHENIFTDDKRYSLQSNEANRIKMDAGIRLKSLCNPQVNIVQHGGEIESL